MPADENRAGRNLISHRTAITVISILFGATAAGWLFTELFPGDFNLRTGDYIARYGEFPVKVCTSLKLYDPFHSFWYAGVLILFFSVLLLCIISRWRSFILRSFRIVVQGGRKDIPSGRHGNVIFFADPSESKEAKKDPVIHYARVHGVDLGNEKDLKERVYGDFSAVMKRNGFTIAREDREGDLFFTAARGSWRFFGNFLFHAGLLIITAGGMIGSILGSTELLYGKKEDVIPLYKSEYSVRIEDFRIQLTPEGMIGDYITTLSVLGQGGEIVTTSNIEVNHPLSFEGFHLYQSSYYTSDEEFSRARVRCVTGDAEEIILVLLPGKEIYSPDSTFSVKAVRFFPDFRVGDDGGYSASPMMRNPALEVRFTRGSRTLPGYLFALHPKFNSKFEGIYSITLEDIEPVYFTGLQVSSNPGSPVLWAGMIISSLGLILLYSVDYRVINGYIGKDRMTIYTAAGRWNISGYGMYEKIERQVRGMLAGLAGDTF